MPLQPCHLGFNQRRTMTGPCPGHGLFHDFMHRYRITAVNHHPRDVIACGPVGNILDRGRAAGRHGNREAVILTKIDAGQFLNRGPVERLVERAPIRGPIPKEIGHDGVRLLALERHAHANRDNEAATQSPALAQNALWHVHDVHHPALAPTGRALLAGHIGQHVGQAHTPGDHIRHAAMAVQNTVVGPQGLDGGDLCHLLAGTNVQRRRQFASHGQLDDFRLKAPRQHRAFVHADELFLIHGLPFLAVSLG